MGKTKFYTLSHCNIRQKAPNASLTCLKKCALAIWGTHYQRVKQSKKSFAGDKVSEITEKETSDVFEEI